MSEGPRTELSELGEFGLIKHLTQNIKIQHPSTIKGIGDDAAVLDHGDKKTIVSTDLLLEHIHFDLTYTPLKHLGYKAVVVNLSDIYAMNAQPKQITVALGVSNRFPVEALDELYTGIQLACEHYKVDLVGGDTTSSVSGLTIAVTAIGTADESQIVYRDGAKENDLLVVSGDLGAAYIGLQLLEREKQVFKDNEKIQPDLEGNDYILERILKPEARADVILALEEKKILPTSMIDISDGLASEILHLADQSNIGCRIYEDKLPLDPQMMNKAEEIGLEPIMAALNGGEDYELLFTISQADFEKVQKLPSVSVIGHITDKNSGVALVTKAGSEISLTSQGWDAFLQNKKD